MAKNKKKQKNTDLQKAKRAPKQYSVDPRLDRAYSRNIRCPYCKALIAKWTTTCVQCGITKEEIVYASHQDAKAVINKAEKGKVLWTKTIPVDLNFRKFMLLLIFLGVFGAHNFYVGRKVRGWIILCSTLLLIFSSLFFYHPNFDLGTPGHPWREAFPGSVIFPFDMPGIIAIVVWFVDWFAAVVFSSFKYPIRIKGKDGPFDAPKPQPPEQHLASSLTPD
ncbi:MAG: TM2 domain-containing protein [Firmicutes bacterium]|nr:TM2 domain-containing protein [Bacillota bacterium]